jgi:hypothetical protein
MKKHSKPTVWEPKYDWRGRRIERDPLVRSGYEKQIHRENLYKLRERGVEGYRIITTEVKRVAITQKPGPKGGRTVPISTLRKPSK